MRRLAMVAGSATLGILALVLLIVQVEVGDPARSCGSAFDSVTGRTGWADWWALDLEDPTAGETLPRSNGCPDAVNRPIIGAGVAVAAGAVLGVMARRERIGATNQASDLDRLATVIMTGGGVLTIGGLAAIIVLVADPDSTLFIYVGRGVVALIGLIALVPALGLWAAGYALRLIARRLDQ